MQKGRTHLRGPSSARARAALHSIFLFGRATCLSLKLLRHLMHRLRRQHNVPLWRALQNTPEMGRHR